MTDEYEKEDDEEYEDEEATSESEEEEYEDEAEDAEASDESDEEAEDEDSVASWGYEEKKSRFSKEMIAGFAAIGVLVAIFGIVVYKKMPGAGDSTEIAAGPEASLGNPEGSLGEPAETSAAEDPNDPFREGAENGAVVGDLGLQTEPGQGDGSPGFVSTGAASETADLFPNEGNSGQGATVDPFANNGSPGSAEPFASNSETADLFPGQPDTGLGGNSEPPFGTSSTSTSTATDEFGRPLASNEFGSGQPESSTAFPNSGTSEFADSTRRDPFGGPDLTNQPASDPFPQGDQFAQNEPSIDGALSDSLAGDSTSALQPDLSGGSTLNGGATDFGSPAGNEPFGTTTDSSLTNEPFGSNTGVGESGPTGLFDRGSESSLDGGSLDDPSPTGLSSNPGLGSDTLPGSDFDTPQPLSTDSEFGSLDNNGATGSGNTFDGGPATTSSTPFGSEEPFGSANTGSADSVFGTPESATGSNDPFPGSTEEPTNLFPDTNSLPTSTASNEPFQPPLTSSPDSNFPSNSGSPVTSGPFGNEAFSAESSAGPSTFASQPANSGTYTVQDGDSYWNISKKVYGTAKYFQVLADHNHRTIADPQKMKTGVSIETPPASVLQQQLKTVRRTAPTGLAGRIEPSGRADRAGSIGASNSASSAAESVVVGRRETKPNEPSGILFNQQGYPLYRIGETDTLTSIASDHLGRASRWQQVYNMNRDQLQSPDKLQIGMLLKLPSDASRVPLVDRTSSLR